MPNQRLAQRTVSVCPSPTVILSFPGRWVSFSGLSEHSAGHSATTDCPGSLLLRASVADHNTSLVHYLSCGQTPFITQPHHPSRHRGRHPPRDSSGHSTLGETEAASVCLSRHNATAHPLTHTHLWFICVPVSKRANRSEKCVHPSPAEFNWGTRTTTAGKKSLLPQQLLTAYIVSEWGRDSGASCNLHS